MRLIQCLLSGLICLSSCSSKVTKEETTMVELQNPIIPGYFADPSLVQYDGKFYMYATADPWELISFHAGYPMIFRIGHFIH